MTTISPDSPKCAICLSELGTEAEKLKSLHANKAIAHVFHKACVDTWLKSHESCPVCRDKVPLAERPVVELAAPVISLHDLYGSSPFGIDSGANPVIYERLESIYRLLNHSHVVLRVTAIHSGY